MATLIDLTNLSRFLYNCKEFFSRKPKHYVLNGGTFQSVRINMQSEVMYEIEMCINDYQLTCCVQCYEDENPTIYATLISGVLPDGIELHQSGSYLYIYCAAEDSYFRYEIYVRKLNGESVTSEVSITDDYPQGMREIPVKKYQELLISGTNIKTVNNTSLLGSGNIAVQPTLVGSGTGQNIKTVNGTNILGTGDIDTKLFIAQYGTTTFSQIETAWNAGKFIVVDLYGEIGDHYYAVPNYGLDADPATPTYFSCFAGDEHMEYWCSINPSTDDWQFGEYSVANANHTHYIGTTQVQNTSAAQAVTGITSLTFGTTAGSKCVETLDTTNKCLKFTFE